MLDKKKHLVNFGPLTTKLLVQMLPHPKSTMRIFLYANTFDFKPRDFAIGEFQFLKLFLASDGAGRPHIGPHF